MHLILTLLHGRLLIQHGLSIFFSLKKGGGEIRLFISHELLYTYEIKFKCLVCKQTRLNGEKHL